MLVKARSEMETLMRVPFGPVEPGTDRARQIHNDLARIADAAQTLMRRLDGHQPDEEPDEEPDENEMDEEPPPARFF